MLDTLSMAQNVEIDVIGMEMNHIIHAWKFLGNGVSVPQLSQVKQCKIYQFLYQNPSFVSSLLDPCEEWPSNYFKIFDKPNEPLVEELYNYGRKNLALIHVMIQSPYVTKIKRDVETTLLSFIADTGGLLGLCLGFSFISIIEIVFWLFSCCPGFRKF